MYVQQLTLDKLPQKFNTLLDHAVGDTSKLAALLIMEQHLGNESGWAPYIKSLPTKDQMHNMVLWDLNELHAVQNSSIYDEAIEHKEQAKKEFLALKPVCTLLFSIYARNMHIQSILPFPPISFLSFSYARLLTISHICLEKLNWGISCMLLHWFHLELGGLLEVYC
jgi:hypothetical protein